MQIPNKTVYKMMEQLEYIMYHPGLDEQGRSYAESMYEYLQTNFKSKPNYVRNKATLSINTGLGSKGR